MNLTTSSLDRVFLYPGYIEITYAISLRFKSRTILTKSGAKSDVPNLSKKRLCIYPKTVMEQKKVQLNKLRADLCLH